MFPDGHDYYTFKHVGICPAKLISTLKTPYRFHSVVICQLDSTVPVSSRCRQSIPRPVEAGLSNEADTSRSEGIASGRP